MQKNTVEPVRIPTSQRFYNRLFLVPKPNNYWKPILHFSTLNKLLKTEKFKMETPVNKDFPPDRGVGHVNRFQGCLLPNTNFIALIHPIQWTIAIPVGVDWPAKHQKKTSCVSTGWPVLTLCTRQVACRTSFCLDSVTS